MGPPYTQKNPPLHQEVALDDGSGCYADESFIYGGFDDGGCNGGSGMIDLNNGLPIQDSGHALEDQVYECASPSAEAFSPVCWMLPRRLTEVWRMWGLLKTGWEFLLLLFT